MIFPQNLGNCAINIYFNDCDLLLGTRCILHLRREQPIVNGAEQSEGWKRRGGWGDNTPISARNMRGLGVQKREEDSSSCRSIKVGVTVSTY